MEEIKDTEEKSNLEKVQDIMTGLQSNILHTHLIEDNKYIFNYQTAVYRVRMPSQKEKSDAEIMRNKMQIKLLSEGTNLTRKQLIKLLKEKQNIDIAEMEERKKKLKEEIETSYYDLAQTLTNNEIQVNVYVEKIIGLKNQFQTLAIEISTWLMPSIEDRLEKEYLEYLTYLCTEKSIQDIWVNVWSTLEAYQNENTGLENLAAEGMIALMLHINQ